MRGKTTFFKPEKRKAPGRMWSRDAGNTKVSVEYMPLNSFFCICFKIECLEEITPRICDFAQNINLTSRAEGGMKRVPVFGMLYPSASFRLDEERSKTTLEYAVLNGLVGDVRGVGTDQYRCF